jgi:hypothetical protein
MTYAKVVIQETADGWDVTATDADVIVSTQGDKVYVSVAPDKAATAQPLDVTLAG